MKTSLDDYNRLFVEGPWKIMAITIEIERGLILTLSLRGETAKNARASFVGVQELRLVQTTANWPLSLDIYDIRDRQWEDLQFAVSGEQGDFTFYCREIIVQQRI